MNSWFIPTIFILNEKKRHNNDMRNIRRKTLLFLYLLIQFILYLFILLKSNSIVKYLEYGFIVVNFISSIFLRVILKTNDSRLVSNALFFTMIADTFLVLLNKYYSLSVSIFIIVQMIYYLRLKSFRNENKIISLDITRFLLTLSIIILAFIVFKENTDFLIVVTIIYFINLIINFIESILYIKITKLFILGLLFFVFCDIFVGIWNIEKYIYLKENTILSKIINLNLNTVWLCYVPSQVLIFLSVLEVNKKVLL